MKIITSLTNQYIKDLYELRKNNVKKSKNLFLVDGEDFIQMAYESNSLVEILTLEFNSKYEDINQTIVTPAILQKLSPNVSSSKIIGVCKYNLNHELVGNKILYLDGVQDPGNVGTLIRTALAFSYNAVVLSNDSASIYNDKVISATKGALFKINIYDNCSLKDLKEKGYQIIVTSLKDAVNYKDVKLQDKFVLVLGNEGQGVKEESILLASDICKIEMSNIDSLNVGVAGGILMNEYR